MIYRLAIRLFEYDFVSPAVTPNWTIGAEIKSVKWEFKKRYLRQEFESDLPFSVKFVGRTLGGVDIDMEIHSEVVEDHILSRYSVGDDLEDPFDIDEREVVPENEQYATEFL